MKVLKHKVFPTLIMQCEDFITDKELKTINNIIKKNKKLLKVHPTMDKNGLSTHTLKSNFLDNCLPIKERILQATKEYAIESGFNIDNVIDNSWFNIQEKDSQLNDHCHPLSTISGVLYTKVDEKSSGICFYNPNPMINTTNVAQNNEYSFQWIYFKPKNKTLLLFPSWLKHGSNKIINQTSLRTSISFNCV